MPKHLRNKTLDPTMSFRAIPLKAAAGATAPASADPATRSVDVIAATETPVPVYDWELGKVVPEVLLMSGCRIPANGQVPLLDSHWRYDTSSVVGSCRGLRVENDQLPGRAYYSNAPEAEGPYTKMMEGHLTDYSIGYQVHESTYIPEGQSGIVAGRTYQGPVKVATDWTVKELSTCPIGADELAKARSATATVPPKRGDNTMNERLRKYLESRGLSAEATEEDAWRFLEKLDVRSEAPAVTTPATPAKSEDEIRAEAVRHEQSRIAEIRGICARANYPEEKIQEFIAGNATIEAVRQAAFDKLTTNPPETPGFRATVEMGADARDKFRSAATDSLIIRAGYTLRDDQRNARTQEAPGARELMGFDLRELARECLRNAGLPYSGNYLDMLGRALTTSDLPNILANVANLSLFEGYTTAEETWQIWCATGSVNDFKTNTIARASESDDLDEIPEDGEYKYGKRSDAKETFKIATFGKLAAISRQTLINDDLGALTDAFFVMGEAWTRKIGDIVYAVPVANAVMGDGTALFHADHGNLGTAGLIGTTTIAEGIKLMKLQKDIGGKRRLNIRAQFVLAPASVEGAAEIFFTSGMFADGTATAATRNNPYAGNRFTRIYEARLDDSDAKAWYLAGPKGKTVKVFFLGGNMGPYMETRQGWTIDGTEFKVRGDACAKAIDWRALVKNAGA